MTRDESWRKLYIKIVNATSDTQWFHIKLEGIAAVKHAADMSTLSGKSPNATNSISQPDAVKPVEQHISVPGLNFEHTFEPYSIEVIDVSYLGSSQPRCAILWTPGMRPSLIIKPAVRYSIRLCSEGRITPEKRQEPNV